MRLSSWTRPAVLTVGLAVLSRPAAAQAWALWLNERIDSVVASRLQINDPAKLPLLPAASATELSLVDRASMPEIAGISIALPGQPASDGLTPASGGSISTSVYLLWALLKGQGLLDPGFYNRSALTRRIGLSLAFDRNDSTHVTTTLLQAKIKVLDRGPLLGANGPATQLRSALQTATDTYGRLNDTIQVVLFQAVGAPRGMELEDFVNQKLDSVKTLADVLDQAGGDVRGTIDGLIEHHIGSFVTLRQALVKIVEDSRARPEAALGVTYRDEPGVGSETRVMGIVDLVARRSLDFTLNAGVEIVELDGSDDRVRFEVATQLLFRLAADNLFDGRAPMSLAVAGSGRFAKDEREIWRVQARLLLPVTEGINVPLSVTWASRSDLIDENRLLGQVGFSFDTSQIFDVLGGPRTAER